MRVVNLISKSNNIVVKIAATSALVLSLSTALPIVMHSDYAAAQGVSRGVSQGPASVADLAEGLLGAVVNISTSQTVKQKRPSVPIPKVPEGSPFQEFFDDLFPNGQGNRGGGNDSTRKTQSLGSGFVISADGLIVTNNHVIAEADEIIVNFSDGSKLEAVLVGTDPKTDIAVLRVKSDKPLEFVPLGDSDESRIGDWVMAIGNPFGLGGSVSMGIVSAIGRDINSGPYDNFIQTDAAINRGNSGGPLFNMKGEVIGINTAIISPSGGSIGIGFSVPTSLANQVIEQLTEFGETRRGWLGVQIQTVTEEIAETLGLPSAAGALVGDVFKDGPAEAGGIQSGDVVLKFNGKDVAEMRDLPRIVADTQVDDKVDVVVFRGGEKITIQITVGRLEDGEKTIKASISKEGAIVKKPKPVLGMMLEDLTKESRESAGVASDVEGVLIVEVEKGSKAEDKGLKAGDVIVDINQERVKNPKDVSDRLKALKKQGRKNALLMVQPKDGAIGFVVLQID